MPEIYSLKPLSLREVWPDETRDFTPWLADHLHLLGDKLNLAFESIKREVTLPGAGPRRHLRTTSGYRCQCGN